MKLKTMLDALRKHKHVLLGHVLRHESLLRDIIGCLTLLEIYWNYFFLLEILEIYWKFTKSPGNFLV